MALVKKIHSEWKPSENPDMKIGDTIDMTNADALVDQGMAVYVDAQGNELQKKSAKGLECPTCTFVTDDQYDLASHILIDHPRSKTEAISVPSVFSVDPVVTGTTTQASTQPDKVDVVVEPVNQTTEEPKAEEPKVVENSQKAFKDMTPEEQKAWRIANLAKGREAAKARKEEKRLDA